MHDELVLHTKECECRCIHIGREVMSGNVKELKTINTFFIKLKVIKLEITIRRFTETLVS